MLRIRPLLLFGLSQIPVFKPFEIRMFAVSVQVLAANPQHRTHKAEWDMLIRENRHIQPGDNLFKLHLFPIGIRKGKLLSIDIRP